MVLHTGPQYHPSFLRLACDQVLRECSCVPVKPWVRSCEGPFASSQALSSVKIVSTGTTNFSSTPESARGSMEELGRAFHLLFLQAELGPQPHSPESCLPTVKSRR